MFSKNKPEKDHSDGYDAYVGQPGPPLLCESLSLVPGLTVPSVSSLGPVGFAV